MSDQSAAHQQTQVLSRQAEPLTVFQWGALYRSLPMGVIASCMWKVNQAASKDDSLRNHDAVIAESLEEISRRRSG